MAMSFPLLLLPLFILSIPCCSAATTVVSSKATAINVTSVVSANATANVTVVSANATYRSNINALLTALSLTANSSNSPAFNYTSVGQSSSSTAVYGLYLCSGANTTAAAACRDCVTAAASALPVKCSKTKQAVVWYDECIVRYSNQPFLSQLDDANAHNYSAAVNSTVSVDSSLLGQALSSAVDKAANSSGTKFASDLSTINSSHTLNVVVQCTPDLSSGDCHKCLNKCIGVLPQCCANNQGGRVLFPSCNLRYDILLSTGTGPTSAPPGSTPLLPVGTYPPGNGKKPGGGHLPAILSVSSVGVLILLLTLAFWIYLHEKKVKRELEDVRDLTAESLQMEFNTIRVATQNFASDRKLGQGGFGEVYKGTLENGQEIAVKRLSRESGQGLAEFKTEVLIVAKLQHRNLVKLLGFCASGKEKILVYEYLPNSSLDKILFDPIKRLSLNWETRFKIISGIAKGLLYLHEDSRLKIVHRDLKTSNILLDEAMNPKIADFGLAKLFGVDQTQDATNTIVGTYGYMAPEYILTGHYSVKSDVYTFGIIVLEVVSGQRNKYLNRAHLEEAILHRAWRLWTEGEALNLVDETLREDYSVEDVMKCIHVGLLCIQENVARRPSMRTVVSALGGETVKLPSPTPPNFLAASDPVSGANISTSESNQEQAASVNIPSDVTVLEPR